MIDINMRQDWDTRLSEAVEESYKKMRPFRSLNTNLIKEYAGTAFGENWGEDKLAHKLVQAVDGYMMLLGADRPMVLMTARDPRLLAFSRLFQESVNRHLVDIDFETTVRRWVMDSLFCIGMTVVHIRDAKRMTMVEGELINTGEATASNVSVDNLVLDMSATVQREMQYVGDKYRIPFRDLQVGIEDGTYEDAAKELKPNSKGGSGDSDRLDEIVSGRMTDRDELEPMIDLCRIWTRRDQMIRTYAINRPFQIASAAIRKEKWTGLPSGPYESLAFNMIPENVMPSSQVAKWMPMDQAINNLMRQQNRRAVRLKENPVYTPESADLAKNVEDARDQQWVKSTDPKETRVIRTGGADAGTQALIAHYSQQFDEGAGNLTSLLGLGAQTDTVGQEQLIHTAGNRIVGRMQATVTRAMTSLVSNISKLIWDDKFQVIPGRFDIPGAGSVEESWTPDLRMGEFDDYEINVYSQPYRGPAERMEMINKLIMEIYLPMQENMAQQGGSIDMAAMMDMHAELLNTPRLKNVVTFDNKRFEEPRAPGEGSGKSPFSHREYVRKSSPGNPQRQAEQVTQMMPPPSSQNGDQS